MLFKRCPKCHSIEFRGVGTRNFAEWILCLFLSPYRCSFCGHHFFLLRWVAPIQGTA